ncbi:hypothetical protein K7I13_06355 [Brucepastera parasyntrophica]|uniref:hypothetical protein n=1 Tax=Brucepastera parasyntrophica TaxID=2880008 RepID=UPI002108F122|nr:hypothetical protein [Brucepastera parasyntrophica]ULQ60881.1 hypothetical protein K7I13_06355 [Brucepastera parasyntrophica]
MKTEPKYLVDGIHIKDRDGRAVILRGCNLGGDSKIPFSPEGNPLKYDVSFCGRPFPEEEADIHFARLAGWGFTFLRMVITWEAVEHAGPGYYDEDYLAYLRSILKKLKRTEYPFLLIPIRMCGAAGQAATARRAGHLRPRVLTSTALPRRAPPLPWSPREKTMPR